MSLEETPHRWRNQHNTPWTGAARARLIELWTTTDWSGVRISAALGDEFGVHWFPASITRKAERLGLPPRKPVTVWSGELLGRLKSLWEKNDQSAAQIASRMNAEFGTNFTRNAILGKVQKLGMTGRRVSNRLTTEERRERNNARKRSWYAKNSQKVIERNRKYSERIRSRLIAPSIEDFAIPTPQRKSLLDLGAHDCRWGVGDPKSDSFFFCGAVAEKDRPYCPAHCKRAYRETIAY